MGYRGAPTLGRRLIVATLEEQPGLSFRGIVRATDIPSGTARHHINVLLSAGLVWEHGLGCRLMHFADTHPANSIGVLAAAADGLDENPRRALQLVRDLAPCHQTPLLEAGGAAGLAVSAHHTPAPGGNTA